MKKIFVSTLLVAMATGAQAEGYVGASIGRGKLPFDCASDASSCKQSVNVFKLYAGTRLKEARQLDLGVGRVDALEVGFLRSASKSTETRTVEQTYIIIDPVNGNTVTTRMVPQRRLVSMDALLLSPVLHVGVAQDLDLFLKAGAAIVTSTVKSTLNDVSIKSESQTKLKPYVAVGASYSVTPGVKVFGSADWVPFSVEGVSGTARALSLGAEMAF